MRLGESGDCGHLSHNLNISKYEKNSKKKTKKKNLTIISKLATYCPDCEYMSNDCVCEVLSNPVSECEDTLSPGEVPSIDSHVSLQLSKKHFKSTRNFRLYYQSALSALCASCNNSFRDCTCRSTYDVQSMLAQFTQVFDFSPTDSTRAFTKDLIVDAMILVLQLTNAKNHLSIVGGIAAFVKSRFANTKTDYTGLTRKFTEKFDEIFAFTKQSDLTDTFDSAQSILDAYEGIRDSLFVQKMHRFVMYALSLSLFTRCGLDFKTFNYSKMEKDCLRRKFHLGPDFIHCILDTLVYLCRKGFQVYKTGSLSCIMHSKESYITYYENATLLKEQCPYLGNPEAVGFTESDFLGRLRIALDEGQDILDHIKSNPGEFSKYDLKQIAQCHSELRTIHNDYLTRVAASSVRKCPFSVLLYGESGIGKSSIKDFLVVQYARLLNLPTGPEYVYYRNFVADFWDGFKSQVHTIVLDDVSFMKPGQGAPDNSVMEVIQIINPIPFVPNMAGLEDKGKTPVRPKFVIATTNVQHLNASAYFAHPSAVQRRFPFIIQPFVKKEFALKNGALDPSKVPVCDGLPDVWVFDVKELIALPIDHSNRHAVPTLLPGMEKVSLKALLVWFNEAALKHEENQCKMTRSSDAMKNAPWCEKCKLPSSLCECIEEQSILQDFSASMSIVTQFFMILTMINYLFHSNKYAIALWRVSRRCRDYTERWKIRIRSWFSLPQKYDLRVALERVGEQSERLLARPALMIAVASAVTIGIGLVKFSRWTYDLQGAVQTKPKPHVVERENPWKKEDVNLSSFMGTTASRCVGAKDLGSVLEKCRKNVHKTFAEHNVDSEKGHFGHIVGLRGNYYLAVNHTMPLGNFYLRTTQTTFDEKGLSANRRFLVDESQILRMPDRDLCILHLQALPPCGDVVKFIPGEEFCTRSGGVIMAHINEADISASKIELIGNNTSIAPKLPKLWEALVERPTIVGDCGRPYFMLGPQGPLLVGLHIGGRQGINVAVATPLNNTIIEEMIDRHNVSSQPIVLAADPKLSAPSAQRVLGPLHHNSPIRYIESGSVETFGSFRDHRAAPKSRVEISPLAPFLEPHGFEVKHTKPDLKTWRPKNIALNKMANKSESMNMKILGECKEAFLVDIVRALPAADLAELCPYDTVTAINGVAGVAYVDSINRSTSAGNPWKRSKKHYILDTEPTADAPNPVTFTEEIMTRIADMETQLRKGESASPVFCAHLKDEAVTFKKAQVGNTRVFTGAPLDFSIVVRKYYLPLVRLIQNNKFAFESGPGTIAQSAEWDHIYEFLTKWGTGTMVAGDYARFDLSMIAAVMMAAFSILRSLAAMGLYDSEDLRVMEGIANDTSYPYIDFFGDLIRLTGTNPSGHPLTVIINGLVNSLYMRYAYRVLNPDEEVRTFQDSVRLFTYGDDNVMGVNPHTPWFNHTTVSGCLADVGVTYTMADKGRASVPYIDMSEISFLKRSWRYEEDLEGYACPLDEASIAKSLTVWTTSKTVPPPEQGVAIIGSAVREYFYHGKTRFEQMSKILRRSVEDLGWAPYLHASTFPTWEKLVADWKEASSKL